MHSVRSMYQQLNTVSLKHNLKYCKNGRIVSHKNGSFDRFSAGLTTNKQCVSRFMQYSFQTDLRPCLYEDLRPTMRWDQLQARGRFTIESFIHA